MAQSIDVLQNAIMATLRTLAAANGTPLPDNLSNYDYRLLLTRVMAQASTSLQQLWDAYTVDTEARIAIAAPQTNLWFQNFVINSFQYSATDPQFVLLDDATFAPFYAVVNAALRIITQCAVVPGFSGSTTIRVAKESPGVPLTLSEQKALQSALDTISVPGINIVAATAAADKIYVGGNVTYNGQYSGLIPVANGTVVKAIQAYLAAIPTTGIVSTSSRVGLMRITDLIDAVRAVPGVIDFEPTNVNARQDITPYVPLTNNLIQDAEWLNTFWNSGFSGAGYMVTEDTAGSTINDSLTYIVQ